MNTELLPRLCPHSVFEYECEHQLNCHDCLIYLEERNKQNERIADGIRGYWAEQQNGSADWRG